MRKSTLFISVVLTTFMLAVLFGVVSAYQRVVNTTEKSMVQQEIQPNESMDLISNPAAATEAPVAVVNITPEEAADVASKVIGKADVYTVEVSQFEGETVYLVTFSSGDLVYMSLDGRVVSISKLPVTYITQSQPSYTGNNGKGNGGSSGGGGGGSSSSSHDDDHEEHEEHDDDD